MLSKDDIGQNIKELLSRVDFKDNEALDKVMLEHFTFLTENYNSFDSDTKNAIDEMSNSLLEQAKQNTEKMDEGVNKHQGEHILKMASGLHHDSKFLIGVLERRTDKTLAILEDTRHLFSKWLQTILDLLLNVREKQLKGIADFAKISLFYL